MADNLSTEAAEGSEIRPEVYAAMDKIMQSDYTRVSMFLEIADQRGYSDFDKFVMLSAHLAEFAQGQEARIMAMELEAPVKYVVVTQEQMDEIVKTGALPDSKN